MQMPGRNGGSDYRYQFNGMEQDPEVKGNGNSYTTPFRQYDPRLGRWMTPDPLMSILPQFSPYVGMNNNPISLTDPMGLMAEGGGSGITTDGGSSQAGASTGSMGSSGSSGGGMGSAPVGVNASGANLGFLNSAISQQSVSGGWDTETIQQEAASLPSKKNNPGDPRLFDGNRVTFTYEGGVNVKLERVWEYDADNDVWWALDRGHQHVNDLDGGGQRDESDIPTYKNGLLKGCALDGDYLFPCKRRIKDVFGRCVHLLVDDSDPNSKIPSSTYSSEDTKRIVQVMLNKISEDRDELSKGKDGFNIDEIIVDIDEDVYSEEQRKAIEGYIRRFYSYNKNFNITVRRKQLGEMEGLEYEIRFSHETEIKYE